MNRNWPSVACNRAPSSRGAKVVLLTLGLIFSAVVPIHSAPVVGAEAEAQSERSTGRTAIPTGNRQVDLLIEAAPRAISAASAASSALQDLGRRPNVPVVAPNTNLGGGTLADPRTRMPDAIGSTKYDGLGAAAANSNLDDMGRHSDRSSMAYGGHLAADSEAVGPVGDDSGAMRGLIGLLREYRWIIVGGLVIVAASLGGMSAYSRRP